MHTDVHQQVTDKIIAQLEAGTVPWTCPWAKRPGSSLLPENATTHRHYNGVNVLLLWLAAGEAGYDSNRWLTYKQAEAAGMQVRKGEKGTRIVFASQFTPAAEKAKGPDARGIAFLKWFTVFNENQIAGMPQPAEPVGALEPVAAAELLMLRSGAKIRIGGNQAYYMPGEDRIQLVDQRQFKAPIDYYRTALHELTHWTGHKTRLDRDQRGTFGSADYAREELVAEMGSAFLCAELGINPTVRHADYIGSWLKVLRDDKRAVFKAATAASKAAAWLTATLEERKEAA